MRTSKSDCFKNTLEKPWLDAVGQPLPLSSIQELSKHWSVEIWEAYLKTLEGGQSEYMPDQEPSGVCTQPSLETDNNENDNVTVSNPAVKIALAELPPLQRAVIESLLLDRFSERETAAVYLLTRGQIRTLKQRALKHLQTKITFPISSQN